MLRYSDFNLRRMAVEDKKRIFAWRNSERVRVNMYTDHIIGPEEHVRWFENALANENGRYLLLELKHRPVGFVSFTEIDRVHRRCTWAFYLGETDVPRGTGSAMEFLALCYAFEELEIRKLCCEVFVFNSAVIKLHEKFGFVQEGRFARHVFKNGKEEDIVRLAKFSDNWNVEKTILKARCFSVEGG